MNLFIQMRGPGAVDLPNERGVDLLVLFFDAAQFEREAKFFPWTYLNTDKDLRKLGMVKRCFERDDRWTDYDRFMLADDDMVPMTRALDTFEEFERSGARVAHPALTRDSFYAHEVSRVVGGRRFVDVPFVELMAPMFTRGALREYMPHFDETVHGWGQEQLWAHREGGYGRNCVRLDAAPWRHTRPVAKTRSGPDPKKEGEAFMMKHGIVDRS